MSNPFTYKTSIWMEEAEPDNPFAAAKCYCYGYDVYGEILHKASWIEYLFLLFKGERPTQQQALLLERLAVAIANLGPRDPSVRAAMNSGVAGARSASVLMSALAVGAGQYCGSHEVFLAHQLWSELGQNLDAWILRAQQSPTQEADEIWPELEHLPGFDPNGEGCSTPVRQLLELLSAISPGVSLSWLHHNRESLEQRLGYPLATSGVAAAAFYDLGMTAQQASMLYLILRLPGAAVHALEQRELGWKSFPYFAPAIQLMNDPGDKGLPDVGEFGI